MHLPAIPPAYLPLIYELDTVRFLIVISKQIPAKPMDIEEAIMQMDLMNKNFFVFRNAENSEINVVYKRDDGKVGIIEP